MSGRCGLGRFCGCLLPVLLLAVPTRADGLRDLDDGWLLTPADQVYLLQEVPTDTITMGTAWWCGLGRMQLFGVTDLPVQAVTAGMVLRSRGLRWRLTGQWQRTGSDVFREDLFQASAGVGRRWRMDMRLRRKAATLGGQPVQPRTEVALVVTLPLGAVGLAGARLELVIRLKDEAVRRQYSGRCGLARFAYVRSPIGLALVLDQMRDGTPALGLDVLFRLGGAAALGLRADPVTGMLGPTVVWRRGGLLLRTSHMVHPDLGVTHRLAVVLGHPETVR